MGLPLTTMANVCDGVGPHNLNSIMTMEKTGGARWQPSWQSSLQVPLGSPVNKVACAGGVREAHAVLKRMI